MIMTVVTAELPSSTYRDESGIDIDNPWYSKVTSHMIHGPCGPLNPASPSMVDGRYSTKYPRAFDSVAIEDGTYYPSEFLNSLNLSGIPPHRLILKIGSPVIIYGI